MSFNNFDDLSFAENSDPRSAVIFVLDCSDSMTQKFPGETRSSMEALSGALDILVSELHKDPLAKRRAEVSVLCYGTNVAEPTPFATVENIVLPELQPMGITNTGKALSVALDHLDARIKTYNENGISKYVPQMYLISDGLSMDDLSASSERIKAMEGKKQLSFFAIGVDGADLQQLSSIGARPALPMANMAYDELFSWISKSTSAVSASNPASDEKVPLPDVSAWASL